MHAIRLEWKALMPQILRMQKKRISKILNDDQLKSIFHGFKLPRVSVKLRLQLLFMKHRYTSIVTWMVRKRE